MPLQTPQRPLSARSVVISVLIGSHPEELTARQVIAAGEHVGLSSATVRVALTRAVAGGDLVRSDRGYGLGRRLLERRQRQEERAAPVGWDRTWEMVVVVAPGRPSGERATLRTTLTALRLAELREGVWLRPANLARPLSLPETPTRSFRTRPDEDPVDLAGRLWDLEGWASETDETLALLAATRAPAERLAVAAHLVRHLATDPLLPSELLPAGWPASRARRASAAYGETVRAISRA